TPQFDFGAKLMRSTNTWSPINKVFSMELEGMTKACNANVMMKRPVTSTTAMDAINSDVVSFCFFGWTGVSTASAATFGSTLGATLLSFFVTANCPFSFSFPSDDCRLTGATAVSEACASSASLSPTGWRYRPKSKVYQTTRSPGCWEARLPSTNRSATDVPLRFLQAPVPNNASRSCHPGYRRARSRNPPG